MAANSRPAASAPAAAVLPLTDAPLVLALARTGTLAGAAEALGVDVSTVFRRLNRLEAGARTRLFDRSPRGYRPTDAGRRAIETAERIETEWQALEREITGRDQRLSGKVRVSASETLAFRVLTPLLADFRARHAGIEVELAIDNRVVDLARREADVALRVQRPAEPDLYGRKLSDVAWAFYGAAGEAPLKRTRDGWRFDGRCVIGWDEVPRRVAAAEWLATHVPAARVVYRSNSLINHWTAARARVGVALLPCYLADPDPEVRRLTPPLADLRTELWIVTHAALKDTARIRAFLAVVGDGIAARRDALEGRAGQR